MYTGCDQVHSVHAADNSSVRSGNKQGTVGNEFVLQGLVFLPRTDQNLQTAAGTKCVGKVVQFDSIIVRKP